MQVARFHLMPARVAAGAARRVLGPVVLTASLAVGLCGVAGAAEVYRCGQTYQQVPCAGGQAVQVNDARDAEQQRAARESAAREQQRAEQLADERRQREMPRIEAPRQRAARAAATAPPRAAAASATGAGEKAVLCASGAKPRTTTKKKDSACPDDKVYLPAAKASAPQAAMSR